MWEKERKNGCLVIGEQESNCFKLRFKLEINMHHLRGAMQYRQAPWAMFWAIFTKLGMSQVRSLTKNFTVVALKM